MPIFSRYLTASALALLVVTSGCTTSSPPTRSAQSCFEASGRDFSEVLNCYKQAEAANPLDYKATGTEHFPGVEVRRFELTSQHWSPRGEVTPQPWKHDVQLYIPDNALPGTAVLAVNNGTNYPTPGFEPQLPTDFTPEVARSIAQQTRSIVISVSNVPNQFLSYSSDGITRREDSLVAHSWAQFLKAPEDRAFDSVHLPMAEAVIKTMDLAEKELQPWKIEHFIATGSSKRAWAAWLATIADERITGIVPFVLDFLNMDEVIKHTYLTYGKSWPLALADYSREGITQQFDTENFKKLEKIEDPVRYLESAYASRLSIRKYIVSASGDDFFTPDNHHFFYELPGPTAWRAAPNSGHGGIRAFAESSLIPAVNAWQANQELPTIRSHVERKGGKQRYSLTFSQIPEKVVYWRAHNPVARDFRYACNIRYEPLGVKLTGGLSATLEVQEPRIGWEAGFFEATFANGFVATSPVDIVPNTYPDKRPPEIEPACKTIVDTVKR